MTVCFSTVQTNAYDGYDWPAHLRGVYAPLVVWDYCIALRKRIERLESELRAASEGDTDAPPDDHH
jgi:hypothetical protein